MKRTLLTLLIIVALGIGGYFAYTTWQSNRAGTANTWQTVTVTRGPLVAVVGATGTVRANQTAVLAWQTSGRIAEIYAAVGDAVQKDEVLAVLDEKSLSQSIILAKADLVTAKRNLENLKNSQLAQAQAYQALVAARKELEDAQQNRASKQYARAQSDTIEVARANLALAEEELKKAQDTYDIFKDRPESDLLRAQALTALNEARKRRDRAKANLEYLTGGPDALEIEQADARLRLAEARLADAEREWERVKNGPDPDDIMAAEARVAAIEATLELISLKAPFDGTVTEVRSMVGDSVNPGTISFRIDDLSRLLVDVQITEVDINRIQVGQNATLTFDAIPGKEYHGRVTEVGRVGTNVQGVVNFSVTLELTDPDEAVRPGMTAAVNIETDRVENVLLVPNRAVRLRESKRVVYKLINGTPTPFEVTLGLTSDAYSQVLSGVSEGDVLVLNPPVQFQAGPPSGRIGN
ncbi:MAG: efflux RND transporter periplasmic adaptor subunit [Anaerolinea sp.]